MSYSLRARFYDVTPLERFPGRLLLLICTGKQGALVIANAHAPNTSDGLVRFRTFLKPLSQFSERFHTNALCLYAGDWNFTYPDEGR